VTVLACVLSQTARSRTAFWTLWLSAHIRGWAAWVVGTASGRSPSVAPNDAPGTPTPVQPEKTGQPVAGEDLGTAKGSRYQQVSASGPFPAGLQCKEVPSVLGSLQEGCGLGGYGLPCPPRRAHDNRRPSGPARIEPWKRSLTRRGYHHRRRVYPIAACTAARVTV
jgi:hypothetical protein